MGEKGRVNIGARENSGNFVVVATKFMPFGLLYCSSYGWILEKKKENN